MKTISITRDEAELLNLSDKIKKLPKWAIKHIDSLDRQRLVALRRLDEWKDGQTQSGIFVEEYDCTGENKGHTTRVRYIQAHRVCFEAGRVRLDVSIIDDQIEMSWRMDDEWMGDVAMIPVSFNKVVLKSKSRMRD